MAEEREDAAAYERDQRKIDDALDNLGANARDAARCSRSARRSP